MPDEKRIPRLIYRATAAVMERMPAQVWLMLR